MWFSVWPDLIVISPAIVEDYAGVQGEQQQLTEEAEEVLKKKHKLRSLNISNRMLKTS